MKEKLNNLMIDEIKAIEKLLQELEVQHDCIVNNNVFGLEQCVKSLEKANKDLALIEVERRKLVGEVSMRELIRKLNNKELEDNYRKIRKLLEETKLQKETNEILIKQGLSLTNQMLNIINPGGKKPNTYNSYGKVKR